MITIKDKILITGASGFIGTNLVELFETKGYNFINLDINPPLKKNQSKHWIKGDIMDMEGLETIFGNYQPTIIIHLAAKTDTIGKTLDEYAVNTIGTENVLKVIKKQPTIKRVIITSTQYVFFPKNYPFPISDTDYHTHTVYGDSKVITEKLTRESDLKCCWTIIRPTNVWGPWHIRYANELLRMIKLGRYFHPGSLDVIKSYAYVKNVVHQITSMMNAEEALVDKLTYYVGDVPINSYKWVNSFSRKLRGKNIIIIPRMIIKLGAISGDVLNLVGIKFPLNSKRFYNMTNDYLAPLEVTINNFGLYSDSLDNNIMETIQWLKEDGQLYTNTKY